jgi:hypothetical protein
MATKQTDLSQLRHVMVPSTLHFYYETQEDGTNVLRHIRVNQRTFTVPTDGVTIDVVPPDAVGTEQIKNGTIQTEDISLEMKDKLNPTYDHEGEGIKLGGI